MKCGLDFGTSNSAVTVVQSTGEVMPVRLEGAHTTMPSAIFYDLEDNRVLFGRQAIQSMLAGCEGRLLRGLKTTLGTSLAEEGTLVGGRRHSFIEILTTFITHLKTQAEAQTQTKLTHVVIGRPVHFVDDNPEADHRAEQTLKQIAEHAGFTHVSFQYEPLAAALTYEHTLRQPQLALIADIGGGTSDFSVIRLAPDAARADNTGQDILANTGVRVGGADVDKSLSLHTVMPQLGLHTRIKDPFSGAPDTDIPRYIFSDLATWYKIPTLYTQKYRRFLENDILRYAEDARRFRRYIQIIKEETGHTLAGRVEQAKIDLSSSQAAQLPLGDLIDEADFDVCISRDDLVHAIQAEVTKIDHAVRLCIADAGVSPAEISAIFFTGGTTALPAVRAAVCQVCPAASIVDGDLFNSVAYGLGLDARQRF